MSEGVQQIGRLMKQVARLFQEGRYEQALRVAQQTCDLTRRLAGAQHPLFAASLNNLALLHLTRWGSRARGPSRPSSPACTRSASRKR
jgi:hypothetical protein